MVSSPASGAAWPVSKVNRVVLPTPFGPITPTMPPRGNENDRSSMRSRSPKPLRSFFDSITTLPRRGPGGIWISSRSRGRALSASAASSSYRESRALLLAWRAFGFERTHSNSWARTRLRLASLPPSTLSRAALVSRYVL